MGLFLGWFEIWVAMTVMASVTWIPWVGPPVNFMVVLYMYISYLYQGGTRDKRLYYGKESDTWAPVPQIIDNDAFWDIHFPFTGQRYPYSYPS